MKRLVTILLLLSGTTLFAQPCLPEGITFTTQTQIDSFQINYPGCTEIEGNVVIGDLLVSESITNLDGINVITSIEGSLTIRNNYSLEYIIGWEDLNHIGDGIKIIFNQNLVEISTFENISSLDTLIIRLNYNLSNISNLSSLVEIEDLLIISNTKLTDFQFLSNLTTLNGNLNIQYNDEIINLSGLEQIDTIGGTFQIGANYKLENFVGLENLISIGGILWIGPNHTLSEITQLGNLMNIGNLYLQGSPNLTSLQGLNNITSVDNNVYGLGMGITYTALTSLNGLNNLNHIGSGLRIENNNYLNNLTGLDNLSSIEGSLIIKENSQLNNLEGLNNLSLVHYLYIEENIELVDLSGLDNLTSLIGGVLYILENNSLISLNGIQNINYDDFSSLTIKENESLTECDVISICNFLASQPGWFFQITDNANGCNSIEEVEEECLTSISENINLTEVFAIYPNPTDKYLNIAATKTNSYYNIEIRNMVGQIILNEKNIQSPNYSMNVADLKPGVYFYIIKEKGEVVQQGKIIKK